MGFWRVKENWDANTAEDGVLGRGTIVGELVATVGRGVTDGVGSDGAPAAETVKGAV
jgi:hypothetical protein